MLDAPQSGLIPPREFKTSDYKARLGFDYFAPPTISVGVSNYGSLVGGTALYFSDLLGYHRLMTAFQTVSTGENFLRNFSAVAAYFLCTTRPQDVAWRDEFSVRLCLASAFSAPLRIVGPGLESGIVNFESIWLRLCCAGSMFASEISNFRSAIGFWRGCPQIQFRILNGNN